MTRPPDRFGLRRSSIKTAQGIFRHWIHDHRAADAQLASALERLDHGTSRGPEDDRAGTWASEVSEHHVIESTYWVSSPDLMRSECRANGTDGLASVSITNENGRGGWAMLPSGPDFGFNPWSSDPPSNRLQRWHDPMGDLAVNALLYPGWRYHGLTETARRPIASGPGRPGIEIDLVRTLPWSDPRTRGTDDWPWDIEDAELVQVIEDDETGAVIEWRCLYQGEMFERHWWAELELGLDLDPALFDVSVTPELAPWERPFQSSVEIPPPSEPPTVTIEDGANRMIRQTGLLIGQGTMEDHADESSPYPDGAGPFGQSVVIRMDTRAMPVSARFFLFDGERRYIPTELAILGEHVGTWDPDQSRFVRDQDAMIVGQFTLPSWSGRLHLRLHVSWHGAVSPGLLPGRPIGGEYAFTLDA